MLDHPLAITLLVVVVLWVGTAIFVVGFCSTNNRSNRRLPGNLRPPTRVASPVDSYDQAVAVGLDLDPEAVLASARRIVAAEFDRVLAELPVIEIEGDL